MVDPINYGAMLPQLDFAPLQNALINRQNRKAQDAQAARQEAVSQLATLKFEADQKKDADYIGAVEAYKVNPTPEALRDLGLRFPEQAERLTKAANSYTERQKQDLLGAGFQSLGALSAGNTPHAIAILEDRRKALKNSGIDTSHTDAAIQMLRDGKTKEATAYLSYAMGGLVGPDHAAGILETLGVGKKAENAERRLDLDARRVDNSERATTAAIARGEAASARAERAADRADRKAAGGGRQMKLPSGFVLDN